MELLVVGLSHRTAPVDVRESVAFPPDEVREALRVARKEEVLRECVILSTCNRTEVYAVAEDAERGQAYVRALIARLKGAGALDAGSYAYALVGAEAGRHLFRVAAGLDSMKLGEIQILGQVKAAHDLARETCSVGVLLNRLFPAALRVGKRARTETEIGAGSVSVASAAVALAGKVFQSLAEKCVLVVGAGETGRLVAKHFAEQRPAALVVANRTVEKARAIAAAVGGDAVPLAALDAVLRRADVVVTATACPGFLITRAMVESAQSARRSRPVLFVDIAVPRDIDPAAGELENVFIHSIDDLRAIVDGNLARRKREVPRVEAIVEEEMRKFEQWSSSLGATPTLIEMRERFERIRSEELEHHLRHFDPAERARLEALTRGLVNKLLHLPTTTIKSLDLRSEDGLVRLDAVRRAFGLRDEPAG